ncbi:hypothetical protein V5O48_014646 [Marasmius crinis-equi]|uniref:F-box domain-containing protein n=1 Tax=Marasmius crinis-equi TaxID=585013 RepID=A0ABR3EWR3_9AGAR
MAPLDVGIVAPSKVAEDLVGLYLKNSAGVPLKISLRDWVGKIEWPEEEADFYRNDHLGEVGLRILHVLMNECSRIRTLNIDGVFGTSSDLLNAPAWLIKAIEEAPALRSVTADFLHENEHPALPYSKLVTLTIPMMLGANTFWTRLPECSSLQTLSITRFVNPFQTQINHALELPTLRHFSVHADDLPSILGVLPKHLEFPNLQTLELTYDGEIITEGDVAHQEFIVEWEWPCPAFRSIARSSSLSLKRLSISFKRHALSDSAAQQLVQMCPNLTHLSVYTVADVASFTETLLSQLIPSPDDREVRNKVAMPKLSSIELSFGNGRSRLMTSHIAQLIADVMAFRSNATHDRHGFFVASLTVFRLKLTGPRTDFVDTESVSSDEARRFWEILNTLEKDFGANLTVEG